MSTFNTRKDRYPDGKPKPHKYDLSRYPTWRHFYNKNKSWWNRHYTTKPRRHDDNQKLHQILRGRDPDGISWTLDHKPLIWYW